MDSARANHAFGTDLLFNYSFHENSKWRFVEHTLLPPACMPAALHFLSSAAVVHKHDQWILKGSIKSGLFLNLPRLRQVCVTLQVRPARGSGKNGALTKLDWAKTLVSHLWPGCNQEFLSECVSNLCGWKRAKVDISILALAASLDTENQDAFKNLRRHAEVCLEEKIYGKGQTSALRRQKSEAEGDSKKQEAEAKKVKKIKEKEKVSQNKESQRLYDLTPAALKALLPGGGDITGIFWMRYHPVKKFWRADYPIGDFTELSSTILGER